MSDYKSTLKKALLAESGTGAQLIPEDLEPLIRANLLELSPLARMVPLVNADGNVHKVVRRTANIAAWFEGEMPAVSYLQSTYGRRSVEVKIMRTHGQVSDFLVSASRSFTDVLADEIESATEGMADLFEFSTLWGTSDDLTNFSGDAYQYSGLYSWLLEDAAATNVVDADGTVTLSDLDTLLDITANKYRNIGDMQYLFIVSPQMISKISGLQTVIRRDAPQIEFEGGFVMQTYRGIPLLPSGFVKPASSTTSPTTVSAPAGSGGTIGLTTGNYMYKIASITMYGEQVAGPADDTNAVVSGTHDTVDLTWTADATAKSYAVYRTTTDAADLDANYDLIDIIAAKAYTSGVVSSNVAAYSDDGSFAGYDQIHPMAALDETVFLVGLGTRQGLSRPVLNPELGEPVDALVKYVGVTENTDSFQFRLKSYHTAQVPWGQLHGAIRRVSVS